MPSLGEPADVSILSEWYGWPDDVYPAIIIYGWMDCSWICPDSEYTAMEVNLQTHGGGIKKTKKKGNLDHTKSTMNLLFAWSFTNWTDGQILTDKPSKYKKLPHSLPPPPHPLSLSMCFFLFLWVNWRVWLYRSIIVFDLNFSWEKEKKKTRFQQKLYHHMEKKLQDQLHTISLYHFINIRL